MNPRLTLLLPLLALACQGAAPTDPQVTVLAQPAASYSMTSDGEKPWYAQESALTQEQRWIEQLADKDAHGSAMAALTGRGDSTLPGLRAAALEHANPVVQGRAIVVMRQIGGTEAEVHLAHIQGASQDPLVRSWAAAARVQNAKDLDTVLAFAQQFGALPGLDRPLRLAIEARMGEVTTEQALRMYMTTPSLQPALQPIIAKAPADELVQAMLTASDNNARRTAAGFVGGLAQGGGEKAVADAMVSKLSKPSHQVPWAGGALYVPGINWKGPKGQELITVLTGWMLFCEKNNLPQEKQQIYNNLVSIGLTQVNGVQAHNDGEHMLLEVKQKFGEDAARRARAFVGK